MESTTPSLDYFTQDCIQRHFVVVNPDAFLLEAVQMMSQIGKTDSSSDSLYTSCFFVLDNQKLVGLLTERDLVKLAAQERNFRTTKVAEVMTRELITCQEWQAKEPITVIELLRQHRIRHLPVLNEQGQLVGLVTLSSIHAMLQPANLLKCRYVKEVMTENVIHAPPTATVLELAQLMSSHHVSCIVIGNLVAPRKIRPLGIITERDIVQFQILELNLSKLPCEQVMSSPLFLVNPDDSLWNTHQAMQHHKIRRFVVANNEGYLVGILTQTGILQSVDVKELYQVITLLQEQVQQLENEKVNLLKRLNSDLNEQVSLKKAKLQTQTQRNQLIADTAFRIRASLTLETILHTTVTEIRELLQVERVVIYRFYPSGGGQVIVESVETPQWSILDRIIKGEWCETNWLDLEQHKCSKAIADIHQANLSPCHIEFLTQFQIKAYLLVPIILDNSLWGLLIAHSCIDVRQWQPDEIEFLEHLSIQVANAIQQGTLLEQVQKANIELEAKVAERTTELQAANQRLQQELVRAQQAEAALREREATVRSFYDSAPMMMGVVELLDDDILHLSDNSASAQFFKTTPELLQNQLASQMGTPPEYIRLWITHYRESQRTGQPVRFEYQHTTDGKVKWLSGTVCYIGLANSNRPRFSYVLDDVSEKTRLEAERKHTESALRDSEQRWQLALRGSNDGIWDWNLQTNAVFLSDRWKEMRGFQTHELTDFMEKWFRHIHPEDIENVSQRLNDHLNRKTPFFSVEYRVQRRDGSYMWILDRGQALWDQAGNLMRMVGLETDISYRKRAEAALRESEQRYRILVTHAPVGIFQTDDQGNCSYINPRCSELTGMSMLEALGKGWIQALHPDDQEKIMTEWNSAIQQGRAFSMEYRYCKPNGEIIWVSGQAVALSNEAGEVIRYFGTVMDITARKQAEEELTLKNLALEEAKRQAETANQAKSEFLANMSHEIRTPMNAILGFADLLQSAVTEAPIAAYVEAITTSSRTLLALINDILDLSKIEAGKLELHYEPIDLRALIQEILQIFNPTATAKNLILRSNIEDTLPQAVYIDEIRLRQILFNVVGNALKFTEKGHIQISIRAHPYCTNNVEKIWLEIAVEDTGIGIERSQQKSIFEAFVQSAGQSNRKYGGTGLGLAITQRLINMMGGMVTVQSELGIGSIFTFVFPTVSPALELTQIVTESYQDDHLNQFNPSTILVVDDVDSNRELIKGYFDKTHHLVLLAEDGQKAIHLAQLHQPDLILLDIKMPYMDGKETAKHLKQDEETQNIPIVIITASSQPQEQYELERICQGFLCKPISRIQLLTELRKHLQPLSIVENQNQSDSFHSHINSHKLLRVPINLSELLIKLEQEEEMVWNTLRKTLKIRQIKQFIQRLEAWGQEYDCQLLVDYANSLHSNLDAFNMDQLPLIMEQFPSVRKALETLI
ncbi:PAS domain-containing protein [Anabaena catenula]|uniref:histidine kinase n=1 Tax=Anabaena catenula FACHB-362 TaxID=2692877 RepID=A0ABR8J5E5_9NOST|nr:PAS domain-containing protein [Anabaena catenula]MBD2692246.1 PAS domain-containing protein [Anabaena catenula FACHB-362]